MFNGPYLDSNSTTYHTRSNIVQMDISTTVNTQMTNKCEILFNLAQQIPHGLRSLSLMDNDNM